MALYLGDANKDFNDLVTAIQADLDFQAKGGLDAASAAHGVFDAARASIATLVVVAMAAGALLAWLIARSITRPLARPSTSPRPSPTATSPPRRSPRSRDEASQLLRALATMNDSLAAIVSQVRHCTDSIATGSAEIAAGNADLSQRTEEQASNLQQTAASMEQLTATVRRTPTPRGAANQLATEASRGRRRGGGVVDQVVDDDGRDHARRRARSPTSSA